jgi:hypothetical protein
MSIAFQETSIPELKRSCRCLTKNMRDMFEVNEELDYKWQRATIEAGASPLPGFGSAFECDSASASASGLRSGVRPLAFSPLRGRGPNRVAGRSQASGKSDLRENTHPFHIKEIFLRDNNK